MLISARAMRYAADMIFGFKIIKFMVYRYLISSVNRVGRGGKYLPLQRPLKFKND